MKKILIIGGKSRSLVNFRGALIQSMLTRGHNVTVCAGEPREDIDEILKGWGVRFVPIFLSRTGARPLEDIRSCWQIIKIILDCSPDAILNYTIKPVVWGGVAARLTRVTEVYSLISGLGYSFLRADNLKDLVVSYVARKLYKISLKYSTKILFQNPDDLYVFLNQGLTVKDKCFVVNGSGVDLQYFSYESVKPVLHNKVAIQNEKTKFSFLMIARLLWSKGIREYVDAARIIKRNFPQVQFKLAGYIDFNPSSIRKKDLEEWIKEGIIEYLGVLEDVRPAYSECDAYVLPSYREGIPRTVLEAMAISRPIITTDTPGCRETIKRIGTYLNEKVELGKNGLLVPVGDALALAQAMEYLIINPNEIREMGNESLTYAKERFDVHEVNRRIMQIMRL